MTWKVAATRGWRRWSRSWACSQVYGAALACPLGLWQSARTCFSGRLLACRDGLWWRAGTCGGGGTTSCPRYTRTSRRVNVPEVIGSTPQMIPNSNSRRSHILKQNSTCLSHENMGDVIEAQRQTKRRRSHGDRGNQLLNFITIRLYFEVTQICGERIRNF